MNIKKDYYQILELQKGANQQEIKKSFRKMAIKWHPDKNPDNKQSASQRFKEISQAYDVLGDETKRNDYDRYGHGKTGSQFTSAEDIFKTFFSNFGFDSGQDQQYFGTRYGNNIFFKRKPQYYTDTPTFVGTNYNNLFKNFYSSGGSGVSTTGAYGANEFFGGMSSVGGKTSSTDIPSSNMFSPANSTLDGYSQNNDKYYHDYSSGYNPYGGSRTSKYSYPQQSLSTQGTLSKQVQKITSEIDGKKVVTTKTITHNKDGSKTVTQVIQTQGQQKTQKTYKLPY